jgi:16S rRNA pseudouridine516 synthase
MRLDRFLANQNHFARRRVQQLLAEGRVRVDGVVVMDGLHLIDAFSHIQLDGETLQRRDAHYLMLHKPVGCASATKDPLHPTVVDLIAEPWKQELHIAGRLDFNTSGLLLLTNDGRWSRRVTEPVEQKDKVYLVETQDEIHPDTIEVFAKGIYFRFENLVTRPAVLEVLSANTARLTLQEGRYHQVKRMFGYFNNKVTALHRERIGTITLDDSLKAGEYRALTAIEIGAV